MKLHELIIQWLRENELKVTERYLEEERGSRPKLIRFVHKNGKFSIVFSDREPSVLHLFKEKLNTKRPYPTVRTVHGKGNLPYKRHKIIVDLKDKKSFDQILSFL